MAKRCTWFRNLRRARADEAIVRGGFHLRCGRPKHPNRVRTDLRSAHPRPRRKPEDCRNQIPNRPPPVWAERILGLLEMTSHPAIGGRGKAHPFLQRTSDPGNWCRPQRSVAPGLSFVHRGSGRRRSGRIEAPAQRILNTVVGQRPVLAHPAHSAYGRFLPFFARTEGRSGRAAKGRYEPSAKPSANGRCLHAAVGLAAISGRGAPPSARNAWSRC
jgi:hypothetical protein